MKNIIIYGSKYGSAKKYAEEIANKLSCKAVGYNDVDIDNINSYNGIIYIGAIYASGILGLASTMENIKQAEKKQIAIVTVGLSDPDNQKNTANIKKRIASLVPAEVMLNAKIFHLRGAMDYSKLEKAHAHMMKEVYLNAVDKDLETLDSEVQEFVKAYNNKLDYVDLKTVEPILKSLK